MYMCVHIFSLYSLKQSQCLKPEYCKTQKLQQKPKRLRTSLYIKKMMTEALETGETSKGGSPSKRVNRGISIAELFFRIMTVIGTLGSAIAMGTTDETLPFFTQFVQFKAQYDDRPTFTFFVVANSVVSGYIILSLPLSIFQIFRSGARISRMILIFFDTVMLALLMAGASAAAAIVYLAHKGNARANWFAICQQFDSCERISGSLIGSFAGIILFILLILLSAIALSRR